MDAAFRPFDDDDEDAGALGGAQEQAAYRSFGSLSLASDAVALADGVILYL